MAPLRKTTGLPTSFKPITVSHPHSSLKETIVPTKDMPIHIGLEDLRYTVPYNDSGEYCASVDHYRAKERIGEELLILSLNKEKRIVRAALRIRVEREKSRINIITSEPPPGLEADEYYHFSETICMLTLANIQAICDTVRTSIPPFILGEGAEAHWFCMEFLWQLEKKLGAALTPCADYERRRRFRVLRTISHDCPQGDTGSREGAPISSAVASKSRGRASGAPTLSVAGTLDWGIIRSAGGAPTSSMAPKSRGKGDGTTTSSIAGATCGGRDRCRDWSVDIAPSMQTKPRLISLSPRLQLSRLDRASEVMHWVPQWLLYGHSEALLSTAFIPDSRHIVSGSADNTVGIWKVGQDQPAREPMLGHKDWVSAVAASRRSDRIASASLDGSIHIWDWTAGHNVPVASPKGHDYSVTSITFSPSGRFLVSGSEDKTLRAWDSISGKPIARPLEGHKSAVWSVAASPEGNLIASCSVDTTIRLWDVRTWRQLGDPLRGHTLPVTSLAFSPDGGRLASGGDDETVRIWNTSTRKPIGSPLRGHRNVVMSVAFLPDGQHIVSGSFDKTLRVWDVSRRGAVGRSLRGHWDAIRTVAVSLDGRYLASGSDDRTIRVWQMSG